jgi:hypothetical protein
MSELKAERIAGATYRQHRHTAAAPIVDATEISVCDCALAHHATSRRWNAV